MVAPNPFSENTTITYILNKKCSVSLFISNSLGIEVYSFEKNIQKEAGCYDFILNGKNFTKGIYYCTLSLDNKVVDSKKIILTK